MQDGAVLPEGDILTLPRFVYLKDKTRQDLLVLQEQAQREVKWYEDALRVAATVLGERGSTPVDGS